MVHDQFHGHLVLRPPGDHDVCTLHGGLYELVEGLYGERGREEDCNSELCYNGSTFNLHHTNSHETGYRIYANVSPTTCAIMILLSTSNSIVDYVVKQLQC